MQVSEYELMRDVQTQHWWWRGRAALLRTMMDAYLIGRTSPLVIADVGSGFGANIPLLSEYGTVHALETDKECLAYIAQHFKGAMPIEWRSPEKIDRKFDVMLLADVLEHLEDDSAAMRWISDHLNPGGLAFITVPAHMHLWSEMDDVVHHFRRYSKARLLGIIPPQLSVLKASFYNALLYPVKGLFVVLTRGLRLIAPKKPKKSYNDLPPKVVNSVFLWIMRAEAWLIRRISMPFGVSLILVLQKQ